MPEKCPYMRCAPHDMNRVGCIGISTRYWAFPQRIHHILCFLGFSGGFFGGNRSMASMTTSSFQRASRDAKFHLSRGQTASGHDNPSGGTTEGGACPRRRLQTDTTGPALSRGWKVPVTCTAYLPMITSDDLMMAMTLSPLAKPKSSIVSVVTLEV